MYIVVDDSKRIPEDLEPSNVEQWSKSEFLTKATSDEGLDLDEGIWYNVSILSQDVYEALKLYIENGSIVVKFYRFDDESAPTFPIEYDIIVYSTQEDEAEDDDWDEEEDDFEEEAFDPDEIDEMIEDDDEEEEIPEQVQPQVAPPVQQTQSIQPEAQVQPTQPVQPDYTQQQVAPNYAPQGVNPAVPPVTPAYTPQPEVAPIGQPVAQEQPPQEEPKEEKREISDEIYAKNLSNILQYDDYDAGDPTIRRKAAPAKVILFGSSKGGTGKTFTCLISAYWYAKIHPEKKIALADFDIIDGQIGITLTKVTPTMQNYWKLYQNGQRDFIHLENQKTMSDHFSSNIDFYLAPSQDIPTITNDNDFWNDVFEKLISNYDVVFFDSGIDYLGKAPISKLYKIADSIVITSNPSINSVKSVIKQLKTLDGTRTNNVFKPGDHILEKVNIVLTRVPDGESSVAQIVDNNLNNFAPIVAKFGQIDTIITDIQWYQQWDKIDANKEIYEEIEKILNAVLGEDE